MPDEDQVEASQACEPGRWRLHRESLRCACPGMDAPRAEAASGGRARREPARGFGPASERGLSSGRGVLLTGWVLTRRKASPAIGALSRWVSRWRSGPFAAIPLSWWVRDRPAGSLPRFQSGGEYGPRPGPASERGLSSGRGVLLTGWVLTRRKASPAIGALSRWVSRW